MQTLNPKPLTPEAFAPYGEVVDKETATNSFSINEKLATRYYDLANIDTTDNNGKTCISLVQSQAIDLPLTVESMEYHPLGSQLFYPLDSKPFLILVAPAAKILNPEQLELFISNGQQGVNYYKKTWHHYLMPLENESNYIVVDRNGNDDNCIESKVDLDIVIQTHNPPKPLPKHL